jgi:glycine cleavage system H lipoate-binding protein
MTSDRYSKNYDYIKWSRSTRLPRVDAVRPQQTFVVMKDIEPFVSPVDGKVVGSRSALRQHERQHNVRQIGNDWAGTERPDNWDRIRNDRH